MLSAEPRSIRLLRLYLFTAICVGKTTSAKES